MIALDGKAEKAGVILAYIGSTHNTEMLLWQKVESLKEAESEKELVSGLTSVTAAWKISSRKVLGVPLTVIVHDPSDKAISFWHATSHIKFRKFTGTFDQLFDEIEVTHHWNINWPHGRPLPSYFGGGHIKSSIEIDQYAGPIFDMILQGFVFLNKSNQTGLLVGMLANNQPQPNGSQFDDLLVFSNSRINLGGRESLGGLLDVKSARIRGVNDGKKREPDKK